MNTRAEVAPAGAALLAFDTSTETLAVAVAAAAGQGPALTFNGAGGAAASAQLLPQIEWALGRAGLRWGDLQAVAFGRGPGAFTGLRTSCAVAQGLGLGLARPLLPLDSLLVVAEDAWGQVFATRLPAAEVRIAVAMDARMDEIYGAVYARAADAVDGWHTLRPPALYTLPAWNEVVESAAGHLHALAGSAWAAFGARLTCPPGLVLCATEADRAAALLRLAQQAWQRGEAVDAAEALPLYLRDKVALTTAERLRAKAASGAAASAGGGAGGAGSRGVGAAA